MNHFSLTGKTAMVTGASRGIGLGVARALSESGASLILVARSSEMLRQAADDLKKANVEVSTSSFDLLDTNGIASWYEECAAKFGQPDILVNVAGMSVRGAATDLQLSDWNKVLSLNVTSVFELSRSFARRLIQEKRKGKVVNIASLMSAAARYGTSAYTASKGAVGQLTKALAIDWAANGILVNAIAPGYVNTELTQPLVTDSAFDEWVKKRCPLGRWAKPEDIAWPVVFLASPASDFITGQIIYVDGGWLATF
jgi:gluconate 5-dehydrogenase